MRKELADLVHPVIARALSIRERFERGEHPDLETERGLLQGLLLTDHEARRWYDFGGEPHGEAPADLSASRSNQTFLGVRYALVCWLDETFIVDSPWGGKWNERKLEAGLYGTNDRAWKFWEQAKLAELRPTSDALDVFFHCVALGFRGELRDDPVKLRGWLESTRARLIRAQFREWPCPPSLEPTTNVPILRGRDRLERMILLTALSVLLLTPALVFFVVNQWVGS